MLVLINHNFLQNRNLLTLLFIAQLFLYFHIPKIFCNDFFLAINRICFMPIDFETRNYLWMMDLCCKVFGMNVRKGLIDKKHTISQVSQISPKTHCLPLFDEIKYLDLYIHVDLKVFCFKQVISRWLYILQLYFFLYVVYYWLYFCV